MILLLILATVVRVVDGDTVKVRDAGEVVTIRLLGIDCPESKHNAKCKRDGVAECDAEVPRGKAATRRARELLPVGAAVALAYGKHRRDRYGRTLAYLTKADGMDFGLEMLTEGLCADYSAKHPHPRQDAYRAATH